PQDIFVQKLLEMDCIVQPMSAAYANNASGTLLDAIAYEKPFFCYLGLWRPHTPYTAPKRFFELYEESTLAYPPGFMENDLEDVPQMGRDLVDSLHLFGPDIEKRRATFQRMLYGYAATSSFADWSVGRVIEALDESTYAHNTIVVIASDNGYHMGEKNKWQKATLWELSAYSPFLIRLPHGQSMELPQPVSLMDIYPTLIDYCNLSPPEHELDGQSLLPIIENPTLAHKPSCMTFGPEYTSVYDGTYRFIRYPDGSRELYNHDDDPHEWNNIANADHEQIMEQLTTFIPLSFEKPLGGRVESGQKVQGIPSRPKRNN
ncbi:MAG: sulfatase-like hydrolase/transferase, partial [Bacteroidota bacterium]